MAARSARASTSERMFKTLLIANRGEIACRVIRTARRLGLRTVAVYSDADAGALHVRLADEAHRIGPAAPAESYLRVDAILAAAKASGADAIHPGYGFLSENAAFAEACEAAGIAFVGPPGASMRAMGSKAGAKDLMAAAGVPVVPGYTGEAQDAATLVAEAARVGFPLMIKAAHGGGGKGMRVVRSAAEFEAALASCQREAQGAFGRDRVLLERYIETPRHIEIQVFADAHGQVIHLGERECSAQRRYQKVLEESPSPFLDAAGRDAMGAAAVQAARAIGYRNAGTVEFIVGADGAFFFMEINTRLQVEHPVTEMVTGLDLVEWQLRVAAGEPLPLAQDAIRHQGHAIEVRLYAEDPAKGFLPGSGRLQQLRLPEAGDGVRIDAGVEEGDTVTIHYDPMIAKLIVHAADRPAALAAMARALAATEITGPKSNVEFLERLVRDPSVVEGTIHTGYLDAHLERVLPAPQAAPRAVLALVAAVLATRDAAEARRAALAGGDPHSPWAVADGWRLGHAGERVVALEHLGERRVLHVADGDDAPGAPTLRVRDAEGVLAVALVADADGHVVARIDDATLRVALHRHGDGVSVHDGAQRWRVERLPAWASTAAAGDAGGDRLQAPMPGKLVLVRVAPGDAVSEGQELLVMEAMKMELALRAPRDGVVAAVRFAAGDFVEADAVLLTLED